MSFFYLIRKFCILLGLTFSIQTGHFIYFCELFVILMKNIIIILWPLSECYILIICLFILLLVLLFKNLPQDQAVYWEEMLALKSINCSFFLTWFLLVWSHSELVYINCLISWNNKGFIVILRTFKMGKLCINWLYSKLL